MKYIIVIISLVFMQCSTFHANKSYKSDLWILGIGINRYQNNSYLKNPVNDTKKILQCLKFHEGIGFNRIHSLLLFDDEATKDNIVKSFKFLKNTSPNDIVILYFNAHGETLEDGTYFIYTYDTELIYEKAILNVSNSQENNNLQTLSNWKAYFAAIKIDTEEMYNRKVNLSTAVHIHDILEAMKVEGNKILFLETCGSGGAINYINDFIVFAACGQNEDAVEDNELGNGSIFTDGFVRKINNHDYTIDLTIEKIFEYMYDYVREINSKIYNGYYKDKQHPELFVPDEYKNLIFLNQK